MITVMNQQLTLQGRTLCEADLIAIRQLIANQPTWSRRQLSIALSELWQWRNANGVLKDMACRALLLKLHSRGEITLPARRQTPTNRMAKCDVAEVAHDTTTIETPLKDLQPIDVINVDQYRAHEPLYRCLLARYHYLGYKGTVGENIKYLVVDRYNRPLACLLFGSAAWSCASRDRVIGWDRAARQFNLSLVTNNTRFVILPWVKVANLASYILARVSRRISLDWESRYGHRICLLETFVDTTRFAGTCYLAANWQWVGNTRGRGRNDRHSQNCVPVKSVLIYPLAPDYRLTLNEKSVTRST